MKPETIEFSITLIPFVDSCASLEVLPNHSLIRLIDFFIRARPAGRGIFRTGSLNSTKVLFVTIAHLVQIEFRFRRDSYASVVALFAKCYWLGLDKPSKVDDKNKTLDVAVLKLHFIRYRFAIMVLVVQGSHMHKISLEGWCQ